MYLVVSCGAKLAAMAEARSEQMTFSKNWHPNTRKRYCVFNRETENQVQ